MKIKGRRTGGGGRKYSLPLTVAGAIIGTYLLTSNFEKARNNLRQTATTTSSNAVFGVVVPQGRAVALQSVRISAEESGKIDRHIYGGEGGEFIEKSTVLFQLDIMDSHDHIHILSIIFHPQTKPILADLLHLILMAFRLRYGNTWWNG